MISGFCRKLGRIKRGLQGIILNNLEKLPHLPQEIAYEEIGRSREDRSIHCYRIGNGPKKILISAGIHGNEVGTVKMAYHLIQWFFQNNKTFPGLTCFVIPCLNPDGYTRAKAQPQYFQDGNIGRQNARNADLNRNFPTPSFQKESNWLFGEKYGERCTVSCGEYGNSEPEIQALTTCMFKNDVKVFVSLHNAGRDVMGNQNELSQRLAKIYAKEAGFRYVEETEWRLFWQTGTAKEWCDLHGIAYIEVEGSNRWGSDWKTQKPAIEATFITYMQYNV